MQMYFVPGHEVRKVLAMPAVTFYSMLEEGFRLRYEAMLRLASVVSIPNTDPEARKDYLQQLEWASMHPDDILGTDTEGSSPGEIKKVLG